MFARDTKASRNTGPPTECFLFHARAIETSIPCAKDGSCMKTMCIELVANRFLRKVWSYSINSVCPLALVIHINVHM
ncbi:hypothetical protein HAX54_034158 [Datura stramonium]|uniref:Uncharacterized protein n=1 Tax=Datura stramonium TaxID=4076 RepID=A0ABS8VDH6_DATST|nr:hypothetical protein [Datura stramonium]